MRSLCCVSMRDSCVCVCVCETKAVGSLRVCVCVCISDDFIRYAFIYDQCCTSSCVCVCPQREKTEKRI